MLHFPIIFIAFVSVFAHAFTQSAHPISAAGAATKSTHAANSSRSWEEETATRFTDKISPLRATQNFLRYAEQGNYASAADYLDLRNLPSDVKAMGGPLLARQLYVVLTRKSRIDFGLLSDNHAGAPESGVPNYRDVLTKIEYNNDIISIFLQRIPDQDGARMWKISNESVAHIPALYEKYGYGPVVEFIRELMPNKVFLGAELFKWSIAIFSSIFALFIWFILTYLLSKHVVSVRIGNKLRINRYLHQPVAAVVFITAGYSVIHYLGVSISPQEQTRANTVTILVFVWLVFATADLIRDLYSDYLHQRGRDNALMLIGPILGTFKIMIGIIAFVTWLDNVGINITALLAGLGVGGLAIALVLQRPMEDILGAISLYTQQPVSVGQFCSSGETKGTIEEIGIRTTKIRTIDKTLVAIPNAIMARASIENFSARPQILHRQVLRIDLDTSHKKLNALLSSLRHVLRENSQVDPSDQRVRLITFGEYSIDIEVFAYIRTRDWSQFLEVSESINLEMVRLLETKQVNLALPRL